MTTRSNFACETPLTDRGDRVKLWGFWLALGLLIAIAFVAFQLVRATDFPALLSSGFPVARSYVAQRKSIRSRRHDDDAAAGGETIDLLDGYMFEHETRRRRP